MEYLFRDEQKKVKKRKKVAKSTLSFALDDEAGEEGADTPSPRGGDADEERSSKRAKSRKNPNVDTSFLPDREREEQERKEREQLRQEWIRKQEEMKKEAQNVHSIVESDEKRASAMFASSNVHVRYKRGWSAKLALCVR